LGYTNRNGTAVGAGLLRRAKEANGTVSVRAASVSKLIIGPTKNTKRTLLSQNRGLLDQVAKVTQSVPGSGA